MFVHKEVDGVKLRLRTEDVGGIEVYVREEVSGREDDSKDCRDAFKEFTEVGAVTAFRGELC